MRENQQGKWWTGYLENIWYNKQQKRKKQKSITVIDNYHMDQEHETFFSNQKEHDKNTDQIKRITWIGLGINLGLTLLKFIVGYLGASQAVIADAVHSLSDMATDFAVLFGVKYWSAPPDEKHPYGHYRIEAMITAAIGLILAGAAISIGYHALITTREHHIIQPGWIAITGPLLSIIFKELLYQWTILVGRRVKSSAVIANAWHHRSDAFSSVPALLAVTASIYNPNWAFVDHIGALIVSMFILKVSWDILKPAFAELADQGASSKEREHIIEVTENVAGVEDVHAVRTRTFGSAMYVDLHILVEPEITVRAGHDISEEVKKALLENGLRIIDVVVHIEPNETDTESTNT